MSLHVNIKRNNRASLKFKNYSKIRNLSVFTCKYKMQQSLISAIQKSHYSRIKSLNMLNAAMVHLWNSKIYSKIKNLSVFTYTIRSNGSALKFKNYAIVKSQKFADTERNNRPRFFSLWEFRSKRRWNGGMRSSEWFFHRKKNAKETMLIRRELHHFVSPRRFT